MPAIVTVVGRYVFKSHELVNILSRCLGAATRALWGLVVPTLVPVDQFGKYSIIKTEAGLLGQMSLLGAPQVILRRSTQIHSPAWLVFHSLTLLVLGWYISGALLHRGFHFVIYLLAASQVLQGIGAAWSRRNGHFSMTLVGEVLIAAFLGIGGVIFAIQVTSTSAQAVLWLLGIEATAGVVAGLWLLKVRSETREYIFQRENSAYSYYRILREIYGIGLLVLMDAILWRRIELFFLESTHGPTAAGVFALGSQLGEIACLPMAAILEVWYPGLSETWARRKGEWEREWMRRTRIFRVIFVLSILLSVVSVIAIVHSPLLRHYSPWTTVILILVLAKVVLNYACLHSSAMYATGNQRQLYLPVLVASILKLASNWLLTSRLGLQGAVIAYIISHGYLSIATILAARNLNKSQV